VKSRSESKAGTNSNIRVINTTGKFEISNVITDKHILELGQLSFNDKKIMPLSSNKRASYIIPHDSIK
jgi:ABC-type uncharacterized transport system ATPase component